MASEPDSAPRARRDDLSKVGFGAWLAALFGLGLYERLLVPGPPATLSLTDAYYYGRLAWLSRLSFPRPVTFDTWTGFPGMEVQWPPGHAWLLAAMQALFGAQAPFSPEGLAALAWSGPVLSVLGIAVLTFLAARWVGRWAALVLAGALLVQPLVADVGQFGEADHHLHEAFFGAAIALLFVRSAGRGRSPSGAGLVLGAVAALPYWFTSSGFLFLPPLAGVVFLTLLVPSPHRLRQAVLLASACLSSLIVVALGAAGLGRLGAADYVRLSGFHVGLHAAMLLSFAGLLAVLAPLRTLRRTALGAGLFALGIVAWQGPAMVAEIGRAASHLGRGSAILSVAEESNPLFATELNRGLSQTLVPAVALLLVAAALHGRKRRSLGWLLPMAGWLAIFALATVAQARFARPLTPIAAVLAGLLVQRLAGASSSPGRLASIAARLACVALVVPPPVVMTAYSDEPARFVEGLTPALAWMREHTPSPGDLAKPAVKPGWAVLAEWQLGHLITALAERPVLASPFGQTPEAEHAAALARDILRQHSADEALRLCRQQSLRYLVLYDPVPNEKAPALSLRRRLASGARVAGFAPVYVGAPAVEGRIPRIFEIAPR